MRKVLLVLFLFVGILQLSAHENGKFDPKRFDAEMQQFITVEAGLTPMEAAKFFPLFKEMQDKQRVLFEKMNYYRFVDTSDDNACLNAIKKMDEIDVEIKKLQQRYHLKFCKILSPGKVMRVLKADEKFHRRVFRRMAKGERN